MVAVETRRFWRSESLAYKGKKDSAGTSCSRNVDFVQRAANAAPTDFRNTVTATRTVICLSYQVLNRKLPPHLRKRARSLSLPLRLRYMFDSPKRGEPATFPLSRSSRLDGCFH